jgi:aminoglycoside/choline kinase family phosphotransferase
MLLTLITSVNKPLTAVTSYSNSRKNFIDRGYHSSNILCPLAAVTSYSNSSKNFIDRGYHSSNILYPLAAVTSLTVIICQ